MGFFQERKKLISLISNARIVFAEWAPQAGLKALASFDLDDFLAGAVATLEVEGLRTRGNELLIVPDYWLGIKSLRIAAPKRSVVDQYVRRKLHAEHPDIPEVENFFDHVPYLSEQGEAGVQAYYFQEALFPQLYRRLVEAGLAPERVTTPGLLWESKLGKRIDDFDGQGTFLVNLVGSECFFYFFHRGRYLFSRDISISDQVPVEERLDALSFEIDQSRFLFKQKAKAEIDRIYLISTGKNPIRAEALDRRLGRETSEIPMATWETVEPIAEEFNSLVHFENDDLFPAGQFVNLVHRKLRRELEWRPAQTAGLAVGGLLLLLLLAQRVFLAWWAPVEPDARDLRELVQQKQLLQQVGADADRLLQEARRPELALVLVKLGAALPENVRIEQFSLQAEPQPGLSFEGVIRADNADEFRLTLTRLIDNLKAGYGGNENLSARDVEFTLPEVGDSSGAKQYRFSLNLKI
jgi:hypothetical protein